jgi:methyltransferase family protein
MRSLPLLDIGCGDGDVSFLFERLGFNVTAVDHELTNYNQMRGVRALTAVIESSITLYSTDLDGRFQIPGGPYGLCLALGVLYHLKNPFYFLEYMAQKAQYCVLTTRVARRTPRGTDISEEALAYLVDFAELNDDRTNYWIFSATGLRRLATRAGWSVCQFESAGCVEGSDPTSRSGDERAYCLLRSRVRLSSRIRLLTGWHDMEQGTYRWTERSFGVVLTEVIERGAKLRFRFVITPELASGSVTVQATVNGNQLLPLSYSEAGEHTYISAVPQSVIGNKSLEIRFVADKAFHAVGDDRELSLLVSFWREGVETADNNVPIDVVYCQI